MKKIITLLVCLLLCGCTSSMNDLDAAFQNETNKISVRPNNNSEYYRYYLPSDMVEEDYDNGAVLFAYGDSKIVLNLNVASIINKKFYASFILKDEGFFDETKKVYEKESIYLTNDNKEVNYFCRLYEYDGEYLLHFMSEKANFYGYTNKVEAKNVFEKILLIARSLEIEEAEVINNYSSKNVIDYQKKQINLFDLVLPVNGKLEELLLDK